MLRPSRGRIRRIASRIKSVQIGVFWFYRVTEVAIRHAGCLQMYTWAYRHAPQYLWWGGCASRVITINHQVQVFQQDLV